MGMQNNDRILYARMCVRKRLTSSSQPLCQWGRFRTHCVEELLAEYRGIGFRLHLAGFRELPTPSRLYCVVGMPALVADFGPKACFGRSKQSKSINRHLPTFFETISSPESS